MLHRAAKEIMASEKRSTPTGENGVGAPHMKAVTELALERLRASAHPCLRTLECEYQAGVLVLRGQVSSYYQKQLAQETVRDLPGVEVIRNMIEVVGPSGS